MILNGKENDRKREENEGKFKFYMMLASRIFLGKKLIKTEETKLNSEKNTSFNN